MFRVGIGTLLLVDLAIRGADLNAMYTDEGIFSRSLICQYYTSEWNWSFHFGGGLWSFQAMLFGLAALFAIALLVGYETRLMTIASWLILLSLHNRLPPILNGADNLMRMLLFWAMLLPLGRVWSVDAWRAGRGAAQPTTAGMELSIASAAILLQMGFVYLFSAIFKSNSSWFQGEAIAGALAHDFYARPLGSWMLQFPAALSVATVMVLALEWLGPLLLFVPVRTVRIRLAVIALLTCMHLGIEMLLTVGLFSYVCITGLVLFLPPEFWNALSRRLGRSPRTVAVEVATSRQRHLLGYAPQALCGLALTYILFVNVNGMPRRFLSWEPVSKNEFLAYACGLGQKWDMFIAAPSKDGWYVSRATLMDGSRVDLLHGGAKVVWTRPDNPAGMYPNHRWSKCFREMSYDDDMGYQVFRQPIAEYLCRNWNQNHGQERNISEFELFFCMEHPDQTGITANPRILRETIAHVDLRNRDAGE